MRTYQQYVKWLNSVTTEKNHGRKVVVLSEDTKMGQKVLDMASRYEGTSLSQVYDYWSPEKEQAFNDVWEMYCDDDESEAFSICSHNCQAFTVSWVNSLGVMFLTSKTEYLVVDKKLYEERMEG